MTTRIVLLLLAALYLTSALIISAQSLDRRITVVEQQLEEKVENILMPAVDRITTLETRVTLRDLAIEGRLVAVENAIENLTQLIMAVGAGVLIQLISTAIGRIGAVRKNNN